MTWPRAGDGSVRATGSEARVEVLDRNASRAAGLTGVVLRITGRPGKSTIDVDYAKFHSLAGANFGSRLQLVRLPGCALSGPKCTEPAHPVPTRNLVAKRRLTAEVEITGQPALFAVTAAAEGSTGSFAASKLSPSATWQAGVSSGDFQWSYPLQAPPAPGPAPKLEIEYSAGSVDGRMGSSNNQPSWVGEGFDLSTGYIERSYRTCKDDGGSTGVTDLCWVSDNATVSFDGVGGALVRDDATGSWRPKHDSGWKTEHLTGAANGDNDGEYWKLTSPDGTQYFFGLNRPAGWSAGKPETNSAWTVPVFGNQSGEPCYNSTATAAWCQQAYRWNLDYVVDRHGDAMSVWYVKETNNYGRWNGSPYFGQTTPYVRGGYPARIDYGQRDGTVYATTPGARVTFTVADRCRTAGAGCTSASENWSNWPDVPWDESCDSSCTYYWTPTFWTSKRLASVTTQVRSGSTLSDVDTWVMRQSYPDPYPASEPWGEDNDAARSLWLNGITRTGLSGGTQTLPEVTFSGVALKNRHNGNEDFPSLYKWRVGAINTESGGRTEVAYSAASCGGEPYITPDQTTSRCYPRGDMPAPYGGPDVFYKYVVNRVTEADLVGGAPPKLTDYEYVGGAAWHYDDSDTTPDADRTWNQWRGYGKVRVRTGQAGDQTLTEQLFLRGMDGDRLSGGARRDIWVTDSRGGKVEDQPALGGLTRETTIYNGSGGPMVTTTVNEPYLSAPLATRARAGLDPLQAFQSDIGTIRKFTTLSGGGQRVTEQRRSFDAQGRVRQVDDLGDVATPADDTCARTTYATSTTRYLMNLPARQEKVGVACSANARYPDDLVSDERLFYDGSTQGGVVPGAGDTTRQDKVSSWSLIGQVYATNVRASYDEHGRVTEVFDAAGNRTATAYTPATGPVTQTTRTNGLGQVETTVVDPARGQPISRSDVGSRRTEYAYDPLGRVTCVWAPGRPKTTCDAATVRYGYQVRATAPNVVTTSTLMPDGSQSTSYTLLDGLLRQRQTQEPSPAGGRIVTDTLYDAHGRVRATDDGYHNTGTPGDTLLVVADDAVPAQTSVQYDGAGRETAKILRSLGAEQWRTTTTYGGDTVTVDPPDGDTTTTKVFDAHDRVVESRRYNGNAFDTTRYGYTDAGQLSTVTDPAGNTWRYYYDLRGRKYRTDDPDAGTVTYTFDDDDRLVSTTDARGRKVDYGYDAIGRKTSARTGTTTLAEWSYDSAPNGVGKPAKATRFTGGNAYVTEILGYDAAGNPTGTAVTIPAAEGSLAGRYENSLTYLPSGQVDTVRLPSRVGSGTTGGLADETLTYGYSTLGLTSTLRGATTYVDATAYTSLAEPQQYAYGTAGSQVRQAFRYETATRRLTGTTTSRADASVVSDRGYTYDPAGNVLSVSDAPSGDKQCFRYDHLRRLTEAWTPQAGCDAAPSTTALGGPAPYWYGYTYDVAGNRQSEKRHAAGGDTTVAYTYPSSGAPRPHAVLGTTTTEPAGSHTDNYSYDASGNTSGRPGQALTWDDEGHLAAAGETSFVTDADGNRLLRRDPNATTLYLDGTELRLDKASGTVTGTRYYRFGASVIAARTPAGLAWLISDHVGTADIAINATSLAVTTRRYLPFGAPRGSAPASWPDERGFVGGTADASVGLVHLGAREYDPALGRFLSVDPVSNVNDPQQLNGYSYAEDNPETFSDPDGRKTRKQLEQEKVTELKKLSRSFDDPDGIADILSKLVDLLKKDPYSSEVRKLLNTIGSIINTEIDDIAHELGGSSLSAEAKKSLKDRIDNVAAVITALGELVQTVLGKKFEEWRAKQNVGVSLGAKGEAAAADANCQKTDGRFLVCGGAKWTFKDRSYTHGNVFLTKTPTKDAVKNKLVLAHEIRHATQWALFGAIWFGGLYNKMDALSKKAFSVLGPRKQAGMTCTDPGACYNPFEIDANLFNGGYFR
ncbi:RHS repeat-associated core domain-containing protein [Amycolatopsis sp. NPDC021455]|uniref:RHS repeat domain-containing protein n=1 Tax=Amycolatopsis sp. NPDC021455 TaxID=3154901 RepID=UPI0033FA1B28